MKYLNYIFIVIGAFIATYAKSGTDQNVYVLIVGIVLLMLGVYRVSKTIPSRNEEEANDEYKEN